MKHCSILALGVLCSPLNKGGEVDQHVRKGAEKENVCHV